MAVNYQTPTAAQLLAVPGVQLGVAKAGVRKAGRDDLTVLRLASGTRVAGVFTRNRFCAAPVQVCQQHLAESAEIAALVINTGIANAGTGEQGMQAAKRTCAELASLLGVRQEQVLPFSTGVILEHLPVDKLVAAMPTAIADLAEGNWHRAAHAIMTTDTLAKVASQEISINGQRIVISGMSKGAGMIRPNMATMLGFIACNARLSEDIMVRLAADLADNSFNCITIDGDTSTNDSFVVIATGETELAEINDTTSAAYSQLRSALLALAVSLSQAIVRDGEGATKFITVQVEGGVSRDECRQVAYAVAHSPLVKTAFFASDPNLGRILAAIGYAGIEDLDTDKIRVWLRAGEQESLVAEHGGRAASYAEEQGAAIMAEAEITIRIDLARGKTAATVWTCDLSYDYVKINADYRS